MVLIFFIIFPTFLISDLTKAERNRNDAIIVFNIKEKSRIGTSQNIAEAFLSFSDISTFDSGHNSKQQIHLTLTKLQNDGKKFFSFFYKFYLFKIQNRHGDLESIAVEKSIRRQIGKRIPEQNN